MTVTRQKLAEFQSPVEPVLDAIRVVLAKGGSSYHYDNVGFDAQAKTFKTVIKPSLWPLMLSTNFCVTVTSGPTTTRVVAETSSQAFLEGDVFNYYDQYLTDFLNALTLAFDPR